MIYILSILLVGAIALMCWLILSGKNNAIKIIATLILIGISLFLGGVMGASWENFRNYDQYVYRFSQYSSFLHGLVEQKNVVELTNTVILFDQKFNARQDPNDLQDVVFQILKLGKYYQDSNVVENIHNIK